MQTYLVTYLLSYLHSRDAIASKNNNNGRTPSMTKLQQMPVQVSDLDDCCKKQAVVHLD